MNLFQVYLELFLKNQIERFHVYEIFLLRFHHSFNKSLKKYSSSFPSFLITQLNSAIRRTFLQGFYFTPGNLHVNPGRRIGEVRTLHRCDVLDSVPVLSAEIT